MFLHLGGDAVVPLKSIVAILDMELPSESRSTMDFLRVAKDQGILVDISGGRAKSFVITRERVYLSQISSGTLKKRAEGLAEYLDEMSRES